MYAIFETGGKQYRVKEKDLIDIEVISSKDGENISFDEVLLISDGDKVFVGKPFVKNALVVCKKVADIKSRKRVIFKFRRRKASKKKTGHRQKMLRLMVEKIEVK
jgi:large subunit ribosomal protein L21